MDRQESFNSLFDNGMDYQSYLDRSDQHQERMKESYTATTEYLDGIDELLIGQANGNLKVLCIAENWCGDCANGVPVIANLATKMSNWDFRIAPREDNDDIVEQYYTTAGRKKIPVIIFADEDGDEITRWVERPLRSYQILKELQDKKLPKEEYIREYKSNSELKPPQVTRNIVDELLNNASKAGTMNAILPRKR